MPTPAETVEALEAKPVGELTKAEKSALNTARNALRMAKAEEARLASRARTCARDVPETLEEMLAVGKAEIYAIVKDPNTPPQYVTQAVTALGVLRQREIEQVGPVEHVVSFKGIDSLDGGLREQADAVLHERIQELRADIAAIEAEVERRRKSE